ncbi:MAG TPA: hypothetical protein VN577_03095 [Terriglobales bacterium]|nr:hypothetical protein [Terriglobales bacterium]
MLLRHHVLHSTLLLGVMSAQIVLGLAIQQGLDGSDGFGSNDVVLNAPVCASLTSTRDQSLPDGNRITKTYSVRICRDSRGRTSQMFDEPNAPEFRPDVIQNPAVNERIILDPVRRIAAKHVMRFDITRGFSPYAAGSSDIVIEDLGDAWIDGIFTRKSKITRTIPVGRMGNEHEMKIVVERWYSPDLKIVVLQKQRDSMGSSVTEVKNVVPGEPEYSLFEIPPDYTVDTTYMQREPNLK